MKKASHFVLLMTSFLMVLGAKTQPAMAHELDQVPASQEQTAPAKDLPKTIVLRIDKKDPSKVEVVYLKEKLPAGQKLNAAEFQKLALNSEVAGVEMTSKNELDVRSSTSSWRFGVYDDLDDTYDSEYGRRVYRRSVFRNEQSFYRSTYRRSVYRRSNHDYNNDCYDRCGYDDDDYIYRRRAYRSYRPVVRLGGVVYRYQAYYGYSDGDSDIEYCDWY